MPSAHEEVFSVAILIDNLKHDDVSERQKSMSQLDRIAKAIGQKRTREELLPFLCECCDDDDEVLLILIEKLVEILPLMGDTSYTHLIFEPLNILAQSDSKVVRDKAVETLISLSMKTDQTSQQFCAITEQLLNSEYYNLKQSGVQLAATVLQIKSRDLELRSKIFNLVKQASNDPLPMVRRQAAEVLAALAQQSQTTELLQYIRPIHKQLSEDTQDAVRAVSIKAIPYIILQAQKLNAKQPHADLITYAKDVYNKFLTVFSTEISWRARYVCADLFSQVIEAVQGFEQLSALFTMPRDTQDSYEANECVDLYGSSDKQVEESKSQQNQVYNTEVYKNKPQLGQLPDYDETKAVSVFSKLISDNEAEVRCVACQRAIRVANRLSLGSITQYILPQLGERASVDDSQFVRLIISKHVSYLAELLPKDTIVNQLLPVIFQLLGDKDAEVRVTLLNNLQNIISQVHITQFGDKLINAILILSDEEDWRIRKQTIRAVGSLTSFLTVQQFADKLQSLTFNYLNDSVNYVRRCCVQSLIVISKNYGLDFVKQKIVPLIVDLSKKVTYLQRNNAVFLIQQLVLSNGALGDELVGHLLDLLSDPVPNIRFMAAEVLGKISGTLSSPKRQQCVKKLQDLAGDADADVREFSAAALKRF